MNIIKHRFNQIKFYIGKYGFIKTIKKCIKTVLRKIIRFLKGEKDLQYGDYGGWIKYNEPKDADLKLQMKKEFKYSPKISVIVPMYNTKEKFFKDLVNCMINQTYANWELCLADGSPKQNENLKKYYEKDERIKYNFLDKNEGISGNTNEAIKMATGDYIALLDHDDILAEYALFEVVSYINKHPNSEFLYSDEDKIDENDNRYDAYFKPEFAPDTLRSIATSAFYSLPEFNYKNGEALITLDQDNKAFTIDMTLNKEILSDENGNKSEHYFVYHLKVSNIGTTTLDYESLIPEDFDFWTWAESF